MNKLCKNCGLPFSVTIKSLIKRKVFCSLPCSQNWWKLKRNKTGKFVGESKKFGIFSRKNLHLDSDQRQLLLGSMLGDGYVAERVGKRSVSYCYSEGHSEKQSAYLIHKMTALKGFVAQKSLTPIKPNGYSPVPKVSFTSIVHDDFKGIFNYFYQKRNGKNLKIIKLKTLKLISPLGLLYWYLDDGYFSKKNTIELATYSFTEQEHSILARWLKRQFNIHAIIAHNKNKKMFLLRFNVEDSKKFLSLILPFKRLIPTSMHYKFPVIHEPTK
jgi:hypothetical protein